MNAILLVLTSADSMSGRPTGAWLEEYAVPRQIFEREGFDVHVASIAGGTPPIDPASGTGGPSGTPAIVDVDPAAYDVIFLVGGHGTMVDFPENDALSAVVGHIHRTGIVAAVCHGSAGLIGAEADGIPVVKGRVITAFTDAEETAVAAVVPFSLQQRLAELGATVEVGDPFSVTVRRDGNLLTGQNPQSSAALAEAVVAAVRERLDGPATA